jgi:PAS domain S-box-containing protein
MNVIPTLSATAFKDWRTYRDIALLALAYIVTGQIGLFVALQPVNVTPVWIPAGIALAGVIWRGELTLIGIMIGELVIAWSIGTSALPALGMALGNTFAAYLALVVVRRWVPGEMEFRRARHAATFMLIACGAALVASLVGTVSLFSGGHIEQVYLGNTFITWFLGDVAGMIVLAPTILALTKFKKWRSAMYRIRERFLYYVLLVLVTGTIFSGLLPPILSRSMPYLLLIFLMWSAFRFTLLDTGISNVIISLIAIVSASLQDNGPFMSFTLNQTLLSLQVFVSITSGTGIMLSAIVQQQRETERTLRSVRDELERRVEERTAALQHTNNALNADIVKRKEIEEQLQKSEERYRLLTELSPNGIMVHVGGIVQLANPAALKMMVMNSIDEALGKSVLEFIPPEDRPTVIERMKAILNGQQVPQIEERFVRTDGKLVDVEVVGIPFVYDDQPAAQLVFNDISERKRTEKKLRESEAKYRALVDNSPDIILQVNRDFTLDFLHLPGAPEATNAIGTGMLNVTPEALHAGLKEALESVFLTGEPLVYESQEQTVVGETRSYTTYVSPVMNTLNEITAAYVVSRDMTERKRAEENLAHERDLYQALVNSLPGIFYLFDEHGRFLRWNKNLETVTGYTPQEIAQMPPEAFFGGQERQELTRQIRRVFHEGYIAMEGKLVCKSGPRIPYYFTGSLIKVEGVNCLVGVGLDMTDRRRAEAQLKESESRLRDAQRVARLGSYEIDLETGTWTGSEELYAILGVAHDASPSLEVMVAESQKGMVQPEYLEQWREAIERCIAEGKEFMLDYQIRRPSDNQTIWVTGTGRPVLNAEGRTVKVYGTIQDITERKISEEAILRVNEELERRVAERTAELGISMEKERRFNESKTEFVSLLSHQFRTPLTIILSASELLERMLRKTLDPVPPMMERNLYKIGLQIKVMSEMLSGVSRLMNVQTNVLRESPAKTDINVFCEKTIQEFHQRYLHDPPRVVDLKAFAEPLQVKFQYVALQTAIVELLHNADQYSPPETAITLELRHSADAVQLCVMDEGKGVPDPEKTVIFELFQRGSEDRETGESRGLGIGLTMVKMCVEAMNGKIWCEDNPRGTNGAGTVFIIEIPASVPKVISPAASGLPSGVLPAGVTHGKALEASA